MKLKHIPTLFTLIFFISFGCSSLSRSTAFEKASVSLFFLDWKLTSHPFSLPSLTMLKAYSLYSCSYTVRNLRGFLSAGGLR